jgi:hypothetical protein
MINLLRIHRRTLQRGRDRTRAEISRINSGQTPTELADRGTRGTENHSLGHQDLAVSLVWSGQLRGER